MTHEDIIRMARESADPDAVDPLCGSDWGDLITLDLDEMVRFAALVAAKKDKEIAVLKKALDAALDFAGTVGGGSSWWEEIWAEHEAAIDASR